MKYIQYLIACLVAFLGLTSCSKTLDLLPQDAVTNEQYWKTSNDIILYSNQFYTAFPVNSGYFVSPFWADINSDDMIPGTYDQRLAGENKSTSGNDNWNAYYGKIRNVNFGLENSGRVTGDINQVNQGRGELRFFRAYFYFLLVKAYGDVPWLGQTVNVDDEALFAPRTARNIVIDSVLNDLDSAIALLPPKMQGQPNRLNRECAFLFKSRVALYEGTWEKYHASTPFGVPGSDFNKYLRAAAESAGDLIAGSRSGGVQLFEPADPYDYFGELFGNTDLSSNPEVLLWKKYDESLGISTHVQNSFYQGGDRGLSRSLVESFLCKDGLPVSISPEYKGDADLANEAANRDPRLSQTFWVPGAPYRYKDNAVTEYFTLPWIDMNGELRCTSGYQLKKGKTVNRGMAMEDHETASIVFRYAEVLLNYAEAKAELGTFTQEDADISINLLRRRVQMPGIKTDHIAEDPKWMFPDLNPVINEIRRERRVELACEGFRFDDLARWAAMDLLVNKRPRGARFNHADFPDMVIGKDILVDADGYIDPYQQSLPNGLKFNLKRDYLLPVPELEMTLNSELGPNPGW